MFFYDQRDAGFPGLIRMERRRSAGFWHGAWGENVHIDERLERMPVTALVSYGAATEEEVSQMSEMLNLKI